MTSPSNPSPSTNNNTPNECRNNHVAVERSNEAVSILTARLQEADVPIERCIPLRPKEKKPHLEGHSNPKNHEIPENFAGRSYGVHAGRGLVIVDIDCLSTTPEKVLQFPDTFTVSTAHQQAHRYYTIKEAEGIQTRNRDWGEIKYDGVLTVGPGSKYDHNNCDNPSEIENCPGSGITEYQIKNNVPIAKLDGENLDFLQDVYNHGSAQTTVKSNKKSGCLDSINQTQTKEEMDWLCSEFLPKKVGRAAEESLMDILRGGDGGFDWRRNNDPSSIDQSKADFYALDKLYGAFLSRGDDNDEALSNATIVFKHFCLEKEFDKTGNRRKCLRKGDRYLHQTARSVKNQFDWGEWYRWMRWKYENGFDPSEQRPWTDLGRDGKPSGITEDTVLAAVHYLSSSVNIGIEELAKLYCVDLQEVKKANVSKCLPPSSPRTTHTNKRVEHPERVYPTSREVGEFAHHLNPDRTKSYFRGVVKRLTSKETGIRAEKITRAYCPSRPNGHRHTYFISELEPPNDAKWIKVADEKYIIDS